jgi:hypothetical protein
MKLSTECQKSCWAGFGPVVFVLESPLKARTTFWCTSFAESDCYSVIDMPPIINAQQISKTYGMAPLFQNISFTVVFGMLMTMAWWLAFSIAFFEK